MHITDDFVLYKQFSVILLCFLQSKIEKSYKYYIQKKLVARWLMLRNLGRKRDIFKSIDFTKKKGISQQPVLVKTLFLVIIFFKQANFLENYFSKNLSRTKFAVYRICAGLRPATLLKRDSDVNEVVLVFLL